MIYQNKLLLQTSGRKTHDITKQVENCIQASGVEIGLCQLFIQHTSASLIICENADLTVRTDLEKFMLDLIPDDISLYEHTYEGDDDMPAHIRTVLTQTSLTIPIADNSLLLGTWQGIYVWEHRKQGHQRSIIVSVIG